mgnify:CR=1 FL=1
MTIGVPARRRAAFLFAAGAAASSPADAGRTDGLVGAGLFWAERLRRCRRNRA